MGAGASILTENEAFRVPHWKLKPGSLNSGMGSQQDSKMKEGFDRNTGAQEGFDRNTGAIQSFIVNVFYNLCGRDIMEDMGVVLPTDDHAFFDDIVVFEVRMADRNPALDPHPQF